MTTLPATNTPREPSHTRRRVITVDGNEAAASVAYRLSEVIAIYPITPSSPMGEFADEWAVQHKPNIWGDTPSIAEMQSEGGAAGAVHGALQAGTLTTTFTASQGLLLMIPNMYKIAGELNAYCMHVAARSLATHALSIFGDHSDINACRQTGFAMLCSNSVQEAHDLALIGTAATLESRVPVMHFFDGFRTSHEVSKIEELTDDDLRAMIDERAVAAHRERALTPDRPKVRGTAQNPDTFFQAREACNTFYDAAPGIVQAVMDRFAALTGRQYSLFEYVGDPDAERVLVAMGSGCETIEQTVDHLAAKGEKVGLLKVRLLRPWSTAAFVQALPASCRKIAVLDRTKEPGAVGEPLFLDVVGALHEADATGLLANGRTIIGGRYGLSSKEFTPAMVKAVFDELGKDAPKRRFTVGIIDDVTHLSLDVDESFDIEPDDVSRCLFYGLGSDGTVGANKNSIKIIGEETDHYAQGYFVYDSKKSGAMTVSHLRFGPRPVRSPYLIRRASFVACHQPVFLRRHDVLETAQEGAVFLLNTSAPVDQAWGLLPVEAQQQILDRGLQYYIIDAYAVAKEAGMGRRINTIMQTCFFAISGVLPRDEAIAHIKKSIEKTYGKKGAEIVRRNHEAVDATLANLHEVPVPAAVTSVHHREDVVSQDAPDLIKKVTGVMMAGKGDLLPVSAFPVDGTWPTATTRYEKRSIALEIPIWEPDLCIECNKCAFVCPHAAIRAKAYEPDALEGAPDTFKSRDYKAKDLKGSKYTIQVAPEDCTGCNLCVNICPAKDRSNPRRKSINMAPQADHVETERTNYEFFLKLPEVDRTRLPRLDVKTSQLLQPLFEYSGACSGCGETPYIKLLTQLFGDRTLIANATGCSSIYGGNLPTTPYCVTPEGCGPAWSNSLFEDNAEFGFGMRLAVDQLGQSAAALLVRLGSSLGDELVSDTLSTVGRNHLEHQDVVAQRERIVHIKNRIRSIDSADARRLETVCDYLLPKSVWLVGGDGWAYDIGYGGLDHVLASGRNVNVLVLDTEVYSNTGGQQSKATPLGAAAKFAAAGKPMHKKDLGLMAMSYGHVFVASVAMGANDNHTVRAFQEAESYNGPSLIIAYSHCIAHGYDLSIGMDQQKRAVEAGIWPLYRFDPRLVGEGKPPLQLDAKKTRLQVEEYTRNEMRFRMIEKLDPERFRRLGRDAQAWASQRVALYQQLAALTLPQDAAQAAGATPDAPSGAAEARTAARLASPTSTDNGARASDTTA